MLAFTAACADSSARVTGPSTGAGRDGDKALGDVFVPFVPVIPCTDSIFKADFTAHVKSKGK